MPSAGRDTVIVAHAYQIQQYMDRLELSAPVDVKDVTTFGNSAKVKAPLLKDGMVSGGGFSETAVGDIRATLLAAASRPWTIGLAGLGVGGRAHLLGGVLNAFAPSSPVDDMVKFAIGAVATGGVDAGYSLITPAAVTATANGSSIDNGAATTNGGVAHVHNLAVAGTAPTLAVKIQHSADNSTFADLITFTTLTGLGSERIEVTGTVNRYVRAIWTIGGSAGPSFTPVIAFARR